MKDLKNIELRHPDQNRATIRDLQDKDPDLTLVTVDTDVNAIKEDYEQHPDLEDYNGFFIETTPKSADIERIYGFSGNVANLAKLVTRLKTPDEVLTERMESD